MSRGIHNNKTNKITNNKQLTINNLNQTKMKKLFFIAAIASAALVSCTKNEVAQVADQNEITFAAPIVAPATKASLDGTSFPTTYGNFVVWGWYHEGDFNYTNSGSYFTYMSGVEVEYKGSINDVTDGGGAWQTSTPYYWPKNGKLTFDAYYPTTLPSGTVKATAKNGLMFKDYVTPAACADQVDVLVSDRAWNKTTSIDPTGNDSYDGVDIVFNHIMSSINFTVSSVDTYVPGAIKVKSIQVKANGQGTFNQNVDGDLSEHPLWNDITGVKTFDVYTAADYDASYTVENAESKIGTEAILIPQGFDPAKTVITIQYYIKNGTEAPLLQTATFPLSSYDASVEGVGTETINSWQMGRKYIYNIRFTLEEVYFAPSVVDWVEVEAPLDII